jgi:hypothetical protein
VVLDGALYDKSAVLYDDFDLLIRIRDFIAHPPPFTLLFTPPTLSGSTDNVEGRLAAKGLAPRYRPDVKPIPGSSFTSRAVARWAINTAVAMARSVLDGLPAGEFSEHVRLWYRDVVPISGPSSNDRDWEKKGVTLSSHRRGSPRSSKKRGLSRPDRR